MCRRLELGKERVTMSTSARRPRRLAAALPLLSVLALALHVCIVVSSLLARSVESARSGDGMARQRRPSFSRRDFREGGYGSRSDEQSFGSSLTSGRAGGRAKGDISSSGSSRASAADGDDDADARAKVSFWQKSTFDHRPRVPSPRCRPDVSKTQAPRRIMYNINHMKLVANEVPLLRSLGYEVYVPKHLPDNANDATSAGVSNRFDSSLSISKEDLALLNAHNFYEEKSWGDDVSRVIEENFCMVITAAYETPMHTFLSYVSIPVGIRVFGLATDAKYSTIFSPEIKNLILERASRCFFLAAYSHLASIETEFKDLFRHAPITCGPEGPYHARDVTRRAVLFQCSRINVNPYYTAKVNKFVSDFSGSGLEYAIYGSEISTFNSTHNLGRPSTAEINRLFASYSAMYYDSVEPRHLHYHPLEAMYAQMPVIFLQEGMLGMLMPYSPARSNDLEDATAKLRRLIQGDKALEDEIVWHQNALLQTLKISSNRKAWRVVLDEIGCSLSQGDRIKPSSKEKY